jgi:hypothetical protein
MRPERMMMWAALTAISMAAMASSAMAGACEDNYGATGIPLVTGITFSTYQDFSKVDPATALKRMARVVKSEGYSGIKVNSTKGTIVAYQETSGSGRAQTLKVAAKKQGKGTRAVVNFSVQAGQLAEDRAVRKGLCKIIRAVGG